MTKEVVTLCLTDVAGNAKMINFKKGTIAEDNEQEDNNDQEEENNDQEEEVNVSVEYLMLGDMDSI